MDGRYVAPAEQAVSSGASHLGLLESCPVAMVERAGPQLGEALAAYRLQKRLGLAPAVRSDIMAQAMLVIDEEAGALRATEARRAKVLSGS